MVVGWVLGNCLHIRECLEDQMPQCEATDLNCYYASDTCDPQWHLKLKETFSVKRTLIFFVLVL